MNRRDKEAKERYLAQLEFIRSNHTVNGFESEEEQERNIRAAMNDVKYCAKRYFPHFATCETAPFQVEFAERVNAQPTIKAFAEWGRGLAKSVWCDVIIPFWLWLNDQAHYMVLIGQNEANACQLLDDLQAEFETNPQIIRDFGEQKLLGSWETGKWQTRGCKKYRLRGFIARALGFGQPVRGLRIGAQRPDLCVIDDIETEELLKNPKRQDTIAKWVERALLPIMDGPIRRLLYSNNKFAPRMVQTVLQERHPTWWVHHIKAYDKVTYIPAWRSKYSDTYYKELEEEIGTLAAYAEYLQEPHIEGKIFTEEQIQWATMPRLNHFKIIVGHWDVAYAGTATSDYNAVRIWGLKDKDFWYITSFVKQCKMREAVAYMCQYQKLLPPGVIIHWRFESQFWNDEVERTIEEVSKAHGVTLNIMKVNTPKINKYNRMLTMQPRYQNGRLWYNEKMKAHKDTQVGLSQLYGLEPGYNTHDDAPDADEQAVGFLEKHISIGSSKANVRAGKMKPKNERI